MAPTGAGSRTRVKICCTATPHEVAAAIAAGADALGFMAAMPDAAGMADPAIAALVATVPPPVCAVLLTAETSAAAIAAHIGRTGPAAVQVVVPIEPAEAEALARLEPRVRRIQVVHVEGSEALDAIGRYAPHVHAFLLDSGRPGAAVPTFGGTGRAHDWDISARFVRASPRPVFLAGGLDAANVGEAIRRVRPYGLDLYSGVRARGALDDAKLAAFMQAVRDADGTVG